MKEIQTYKVSKVLPTMPFLKKLIRYLLHQNEQINHEDMKNKNRDLIQEIEPEGIPKMMKENPRMTAVQQARGN